MILKERSYKKIKEKIMPQRTRNQLNSIMLCEHIWK